jgi:hypothetical protein
MSTILNVADWDVEERTVSPEDRVLGISERYVAFDTREPSPTLYFLHRLHGVWTCSCGWPNCGHKALIPTPTTDPGPLIA